MPRPQSRRCVVIGAGVLGASVATALASAGQRVTLLEQDQPGRATTRWSFAWLNSNDKSPRHYHDLNHAGIKAWADLAPDLDGNAWYRPAGNLELATANPAELEARVRRLTEWGYPACLVDAAEASEIEPSLQTPGPAAWFPGEGYVLTEPLIARLVTAAESHGADVLTGEPGHVTSLEPGQPARIRTAAGRVLETDHVICCAGRWTPGLAELAGTEAGAETGPGAGAATASPVPLIPWDTPGSTAPGLVVRVGPVTPAGPVRVIHAPDVYLRPHSGHRLQLEAPDAAVDLHTPEPELRRWAAELLQRARRTVRGLAGARVEDYQVCPRPLPADGRSIVGPLPGANGCYVAVTHSAVTLAARLATLIAADLTTDTPPAALAPYRPARFRPGV